MIDAPMAEIDIGIFFFTPPSSTTILGPIRIIKFFLKCAFPPKSALLFGFYSTVWYTAAAAVVHTIDRHD